MARYVGTVNFWCETGTEGMIWVFMQHEKVGYDGLLCLEKDDHLTIYDDHEKIIFDGIIDPDEKIGQKQHPFAEKGVKQPAALGYWIHWTQKGWQPNDWAALFIRDPLPPLKAILIRKKAVLVKQ